MLMARVASVKRTRYYKYCFSSITFYLKNQTELYEGVLMSHYTFVLMVSLLIVLNQSTASRFFDVHLIHFHG